MQMEKQDWSAAPLIWGSGERLFEVFLEPTCPFSGRAFAKLEDLLIEVGHDQISIRIWLHSQPWHLFSGFICRAIVAASTGPSGKDAARKVMAAIYADREAFEFDDHRAGPNLNTSPNDLIARIEQVSGIDIGEAFQFSGLEREVKKHTRYARQNGIHVSPTFMVDGLIDPEISSGGTASDWSARIFDRK